MLLVNCNVTSIQVIIIADQFAPDPDDEDAKNIMRVIAIKNVCEEIKVVIEVLQYYNKVIKFIKLKSIND